MRNLLYVGLLLTFYALPVKATTYPAATCNSSDVATAINAAIAAAHDGDIVSIPSGTCTWTTAVNGTFTSSVTIQGAGAISATTGGASTTGTDQTTIIDNISGTNHNVMSFSTTAGKSFRLTGIAILQNSSSIVAGNGLLGISGTSTSVRIDHNHFYSYVSGNKGIIVGGRVLGVADHNFIDARAGIITNDFAFYNGANWNGINDQGYGDASWADTSHFGTSQFFFTEDNLFNNGWFSDCVMGGRYVHRHNTGNNVAGTANHGTSFRTERGCRAAEIYGNTYNGTPFPNGNAAYSNNSGTALIWGNTVSSSYQNVVTLDVPRKSNNYGGETPPPNGWGYCGTNFSGTGSAWDQNAVTTTGSACMDSPARGRGDFLSGNFPNVCNITLNPACNIFTGQWPRQDLDPLYIFANTYSTTLVADGSGMLSANRDYYVPSGSFNGTSGIGSGSLSARPATCAAGPGGNTPGVGYWATDTNTLYVCNPTNTWTAYYTPYTYPHPLIAGGTAGTGSNLPNPPTSLAATVQ
jgi:hypothetical protein